MASAAGLRAEADLARQAAAAAGQVEGVVEAVVRAEVKRSGAALAALAAAVADAEADGLQRAATAEAEMDLLRGRLSDAQETSDSLRAAAAEAREQAAAAESAARAAVADSDARAAGAAADAREAREETQAARQRADALASEVGQALAAAAAAAIAAASASSATVATIAAAASIKLAAIDAERENAATRASVAEASLAAAIAQRDVAASEAEESKIAYESVKNVVVATQKNVLLQESLNSVLRKTLVDIDALLPSAVTALFSADDARDSAEAARRKATDAAAESARARAELADMLEDATLKLEIWGARFSTRGDAGTQASLAPLTEGEAAEHATRMRVPPMPSSRRLLLHAASSAISAVGAFAAAAERVPQTVPMGDMSPGAAAVETSDAHALAQAATPLSVRELSALVSSLYATRLAQAREEEAAQCAAQAFALFVPQQQVVRHRTQRLADAATGALAASLHNQRESSNKAALFGRLCGLWEPISPPAAVAIFRTLAAVEEALGRPVRASEWSGARDALCLVHAPLAMRVLTKTFSHAPASEFEQIRQALVAAATALPADKGLRAASAPPKLSGAHPAAEPAELLAPFPGVLRPSRASLATSSAASSLDGLGVDLDALLALTADRAADERARSSRLLSGLFRAADGNGDGVLSIDEFAELVRRVSGRVGERELLSMYAEAHALSASEQTDSAGGPHLPGIDAGAFASVALRHGLLLLGAPAGGALTDPGPTAGAEEVAAVLLEEWFLTDAKIRSWPPKADGKRELQQRSAEMSRMVNQIADGAQPPPQNLLDDAWGLYRRIAAMVHRLEAELPEQHLGGTGKAPAGDRVDSFLLSDDALADYERIVGLGSGSTVRGRRTSLGAFGDGV
ncbi:hypothetical protein T492DRAFT_552131 [Pavlovales sp. CCMP2436]|nr:hypothetical protein T492DRAFT_552131 [Pavlovales sp. CCMP2436]